MANDTIKINLLENGEFSPRDTASNNKVGG